MFAEVDTMKFYMERIGQYSLVTPREEVELAAQIKAGSDGARAKLINSNLRLVVKIAHDFKGRGLPLVDLIAEGNIGLMKAVEKFDPSKGAKLSSYAAWWIKQAMRRALANQARTIRIPTQSASKLNQINTARTKLRQELGREPTTAEVAAAAELTERTVTGLGTVKTTTISLDAPIQEGESGEFRDIIADTAATTPTEILQDQEDLSRVFQLVDRLDEREYKIICLRFGLNGERPRTLEEVSAIIGRTRERIRQIQNRALKKLRGMLEEEAEDDEGRKVA